MENKIILRNVFGKAKAECIINPMTQVNGLPYPFVKKVRINGLFDTEMILSESEMNHKDRDYFIPENYEIKLYDGVTFDLENPLDKNVWESIKRSPLIAPERDAKDSKGNLLIDGGPMRYGKAEFYIERPGAEAIKRNSKIQLLTKAYNYIIEDTEKGRQTKVKLLGKNMPHAHASDIQDYLYQRAEKSPQDVINIYEEQDSTLKLLFIDAKDLQIIQLDKGIWMHGEIKLGATEDAVILMLKQPANKYIYDSICKLTYPEMFAVNEANETKSKRSTKTETPQE